jgi:hypothetical protein
MALTLLPQMKLEACNCRYDTRSEIQNISIYEGPQEHEISLRGSLDKSVFDDPKLTGRRGHISKIGKRIYRQPPHPEMHSHVDVKNDNYIHLS